MKPFPVYTFLLLLLLSVVACSKDAATDTVCHSYSFVYGTAITGPDTVASGVYAQYNIRYSIPNSCGKLLGVQVARPDVMTEKLTVQLENTGCACADVIFTDTIPFGFQRNGPAIYYIQLAQPDGRPVIEKKIVVR